MLTPADIDKKEFGTTRIKEGYDQDEVDDFLDAVRVALEAALMDQSDAEAEAVSLRSRVAVLQRQLDAYGDHTSTEVIPVITDAQPIVAKVDAPQFTRQLSRVLDAAQRAADEQMAEARAEAEKRIAEAAETARTMLAESTRAADEARMKAQSELFRVQEALNDVRARESVARAFVTEHLTALQNGLESRDV